MTDDDPGPKTEVRPEPSPVDVAARVFISYASRDVGVAEKLCAALEASGLPCWIAPRDVPAGESYAAAIVHAINTCGMVVLVLSKDSIDSPHVLREIERASSKRRSVLSVQLDAAGLSPELEYFVSANHWLDASGGPIERIIPVLIESVRSRIAAAHPHAELTPSPAPSTPPPPWRKPAVMAGLAVIAVGLAYVLADNYLLPRSADEQKPLVEATPATNATGESKSDRPSIAVLPFVNMSNDSQNAYFSDGLTEEILNLLVRLQVIDVAARTSSFYFKGKDVDIKTVASHLGVTNVLEGSVRRDGEKIRVTAQLINAETGFHLWSNTYDREIKDIFTIQDDIARQVVDALEIVLSSESSAILERVPTASVEAYEHYLRGRDRLRGGHSETSLQSALALFERSIVIDPRFAEAHAGLCDSHLALYNRNRSTESFENAERACNRGLTLDSGAGAVYVSLGNLYRYSGQHDKAVVNFKKAIAINDKDVAAYTGLAETYRDQSNFDQAEQYFQRAIDIQPGYWRGHLDMGNFLYFSGRIREATEAYKRGVELAPEVATGYLNLGSSYYLLGDFKNAASAWKKSLALEPSTSAYMNLGSSYFFLRRFDDAAAMYKKASELSPDDYEVWGSLGDALSHTGDGDEKAMQAYQKAVELGEKALAINAADAPMMATLSQYHARLGDVERAMQLVSQAEKLQPRNMYVRYFAAVTHATAGDTDAALDAIEKAVKLGYPRTLLAMDAGLARLAPESRFKALIAGGGN